MPDFYLCIPTTNKRDIEEEEVAEYVCWVGRAVQCRKCHYVSEGGGGQLGLGYQGC
jgi:hypothetical protein